MAEAALVKESLSEELKSAGAELLRRLDEKRVPVPAAFWFYLPEANRWRLMLGSPLVRHGGPKRLYKKIQSQLAKSRNTPLRLNDITVLDTREPLILRLSSAVRTGPGIVGRRISQNMINGVFVDDAYVYRLSRQAA